jgi:hypothetical protein
MNEVLQGCTRWTRMNEVLQGCTSSYAATNPRKEGKDKVP